MNSSMIITEPLTRSAWRRSAGPGRRCSSDAAHVYVYLQRTEDGRIAIGGRGVPYRFPLANRRVGRHGAGDRREPAREAREHVPSSVRSGHRSCLVGRARRAARLVHLGRRRSRVRARVGGRIRRPGRRNRESRRPHARGPAVRHVARASPSCRGLGAGHGGGSPSRSAGERSMASTRCTARPTASSSASGVPRAWLGSSTPHPDASEARLANCPEAPRPPAQALPAAASAPTSSRALNGAPRASARGSARPCARRRPDPASPRRTRAEHRAPPAPGPALAVDLTVRHVPNQQVQDPLTVIAAIACQMSALSPVASKPRGECRCRAPRTNSSWLRSALSCGPCSGSSSAVCVGCGSVKVRVEAAVEQVDRLEIDCERSLRAASKQLLGDRHRVVVRDEHGRADALVCPHALDQIRLLVQRVVVVGRLFRGAEAEEVEQQQRVSAARLRARPWPSRARSSGSRAAASSPALPRGEEIPCARRRPAQTAPARPRTTKHPGQSSRALSRSCGPTMPASERRRPAIVLRLDGGLRRIVGSKVALGDRSASARRPRVPSIVQANMRRNRYIVPLVAAVAWVVVAAVFGYREPLGRSHIDSAERTLARLPARDARPQRRPPRRKGRCLSGAGHRHGQHADANQLPRHARHQHSRRLRGRLAQRVPPRSRVWLLPG